MVYIKAIPREEQITYLKSKYTRQVVMLVTLFITIWALTLKHQNVYILAISFLCFSIALASYILTVFYRIRPIPDYPLVVIRENFLYDDKLLRTLDEHFKVNGSINSFDLQRIQKAINKEMNTLLKSYKGEDLAIRVDRYELLIRLIDHIVLKTCKGLKFSTKTSLKFN